jgi:hypothetical protein
MNSFLLTGTTERACRQGRIATDLTNNHRLSSETKNIELYKDIVSMQLAA